MLSVVAVVAVVGGTNIRLAVCDLETGVVSKLKEFACADFITLEAAITILTSKND